MDRVEEALLVSAIDQDLKVYETKHLLSLLQAQLDVLPKWRIFKRYQVLKAMRGSGTILRTPGF